MPENPNPQGKGGNPVLATLEEQRAGLGAVPAKQIKQVTTELFTSLFVLESEFRFKPVRGKSYFLYQQDDAFKLRLTPPGILGEAVGGRFIGVCELQQDMTWTLELAGKVAADETFMAKLEYKRAAFEQRLDEVDTIDDALPVFERRFSFYRQAFAFAVSHSLSRSMQQSGISGLSYEQALGQLSHDERHNESEHP